ncbi:hypothetical protein D7231_35325 [Streptomyces klenkii]|uniref:Putative sensor domain-containing protein n=1 Tax=Streptomyces klenkii TaxID=1420899 RepID=A0A3A9ZVW3_9ACTN|nr:sensor domain-containing protein [Streptomyces klenkii]RKN52319.1 hypothetical protein D7231_35325 [Streptomyces klenkii]
MADVEIRAAGRPGWLGRFGRELAYVMGGLPVAVAALTVAVTGLSFGLSTLVVWVGLPALAGTLMGARAFAGMELRRLERLAGRRPRAAVRAGGDGLRALRDGWAWRALAHMVVAFPLRVAAFCVALTWTVGGLGSLLYVTWSWSLPRDEGETGLFDLMTGNPSEAADIAFTTAAGAVLLATSVPVVRALATADAALTRGLVSGMPRRSLPPGFVQT